MVVFQALTWEARDSDDDGHLISIFGKTEDGRSVCVTTEFTPYFYIKLPDAQTATIKEIYHVINKRCPECLVGYGLKKAKDVWGFQNNEEFPFMRLDCGNVAKRRHVASTLKYAVQLARGSTKLKVYEANLDPMLRLMHRTGIQSTGWLDTGDKCVRSHLAHVDIDLFCNDWTTLVPVKRDDIAPFVVASVDIECNSSTGKFPDADVEGDCCFQIALTLCKFGSDVPYEEVCLCYKKTSGDKVKSYDTEKELLEAFQKYLLAADVDIITGWNIFGFDLEYIMKRAVVCRCGGDFYNLGKFKNDDCQLVYKKLSSSALGDNELKLLPMSGRFIFDLFHEVKKGYKLDSYKLNSVAQLYLGDQKLDMPPREIFARFQGGDPDKLGEVADYCIKDTLLPHKLLAKLCILVNLVEMAKATSVPLCFLVERGQQIKVFSQLCKKAAELGFLVPVIYPGSLPEEGYEGATVLEAQSGAYYTPITALDFASLYPSIMMAHNLCYSTLVMDEKKYGNVPGVEYETFTLGSGKSYKFAQNVPSLLPTILAELKQFRKQAKKDMAAATTQAMKEVYNGKQLAYKISMNSCYGFTGAAKGMLPCVAIASSVTFKGRSMIEETKNYVEANFPGAKVRYGDTDSVMVEFDVQGRTGQDAIDYSWQLGEQAAEQCTRLFKKPNDLELEKVYMPYILYSKKRYAAKLWEKNGKTGKVEFKYIDVKGLQLVRRDNTPHVREVCKELLDVILTSSDPGPPQVLARERALELLTGDVPHKKLILSQSLSDTYKVKGQPVSIKDIDRSWDISMGHVQVHNKMRQRKPGSEPQSGDRVPYLLTKTDDPKAKAFEKAEDPQYVEEHNIPVDYHYYFVNKFLNPVCDLLEPLVSEPKQTIFGEIIEKNKPPKKQRAKAAPKQKTTITDLFKKFELSKSSKDG
ncbi:polymerase [Dishui Lake phycodnavirus 2]|nr:polymerase [Dishui Lake phycodnavirus 2]